MPRRQANSCLSKAARNRLPSIASATFARTPERRQAATGPKRAMSCLNRVRLGH